MTKNMRKVALITGITGQDGSFLAEFLIEDLQPEIKEDKLFLDPTCGSGTFLVILIKKIITIVPSRWHYNSIHLCKAQNSRCKVDYQTSNQVFGSFLHVVYRICRHLHRGHISDTCRN